MAKTIRIVELPGLTGHPNNKDVSDWLDADPRRADKLSRLPSTHRCGNPIIMMVVMDTSIMSIKANQR